MQIKKICMHNLKMFSLSLILWEENHEEKAQKLKELLKDNRLQAKS